MMQVQRITVSSSSLAAGISSAACVRAPLRHRGRRVTAAASSPSMQQQQQNQPGEDGPVSPAAIELAHKLADAAALVTTRYFR